MAVSRYMSTINTASASRTLLQQGSLSASAASALGATAARNVSVPNLNKVTTDPDFACFLIDASGSMEPYTQEVIDGQALMIDWLRESEKCQRGALFVVQYLFAEKPVLLNPFTELSASGNDDVVVLKDKGGYKPDHGTALYKSLFHLLQDMAANIANAENQGLRATFTVGIITDGEDTENGVAPADIATVVDELHQKGYLRSSVIIGLTHSKFTPHMLEELRSRLGFKDAISMAQNGRDIRRAFLLPSQMATSAAR